MTVVSIKSEMLIRLSFTFFYDLLDKKKNLLRKQKSVQCISPRFMALRFRVDDIFIGWKKSRAKSPSKLNFPFFLLRNKFSL